MELFKLATEEAKGNDSLINTIVKEILHYDIMEALYRSNIAKNIVFQGGTALRLCYGGNRYSEDLDFVLRKNVSFTPELMEGFEDIFVNTVRKKYGLNAEVKLPKEKNEDSKGVRVDKWTAKVLLPSKGIQQPKIHIEIANVPSYDNEVKFITSNYGSVSTMSALYVESLQEILADKIIAIAGREYFKARDFWDIKWLSDKGILVNKALVLNKIYDYNIKLEVFFEKFYLKLVELEQSKTKALFKKEMSRFLDQDVLRIFEFEGSINAIFDSTRKLKNIINLNEFTALAKENKGLEIDKQSPADQTAELLKAHQPTQCLNQT